MDKHPQITTLEQQLGLSLQPLKGSVADCMRHAYQGYYVEEAGQVVALNLRHYDLKDPQMEFLSAFPFFARLESGG